MNKFLHWLCLLSSNYFKDRFLSENINIDNFRTDICISWFHATFGLFDLIVYGSILFLMVSSILFRSVIFLTKCNKVAIVSNPLQVGFVNIMIEGFYLDVL